MWAFPSFVFTVLVAIDVLELMEAGSTFTFPGLYAVASLSFLFFANAPFVLFGSWVGRDPNKMQAPCKTNRMKREIP
jgi:hypothetical protein